MSPILPVARHLRDDDDDDTVPVPRHRAIEPSILESAPSGARRLNRDARRLYSGEISLYRETSASRRTKRRLQPVNFLISSLRPFGIDARRMTRAVRGDESRTRCSRERGRR